jgi:PTH1 family peptidyl-tRNA hydrolase
MWLIAGLGNPGAQYAATRHNIGFMVLDRLAQRCAAKLDTKKFNARLTATQLCSQKVLLAKPQTFMNCSGDSLQPMAAFYKLSVERLVVVHDELDLEFGDLRVKVAGGHAGHNGLRSIGKRFGSAEYARVRVGIGRPDHGGDVTSHVLGGFNRSESTDLDAVIERACDALEAILKSGATAAMNTINGLPPVVS